MNSKSQPFLIECSYEVCNQLGGIYTVIRSKIPATIKKWGDDYCLIGPLVGQGVMSEIDEIKNDKSDLGKAVSSLKKKGLKIIYGTWLVTGRPKVLLIDIASAMEDITEIRKEYYDKYKIAIQNDELQLKVLAFAHLTTLAINELSKNLKENTLIANFHEWMAALPILPLKQNEDQVKTVFTTHATAVGRYVAMNEPDFYNNLSSFQWDKEARKYNILEIAAIEKKCAEQCNTFTTVSSVTALECSAFLGRTPDIITPNGLNIERFAAYHEVQNLHQEYKEKIHEFVVGHFFNHSPFNLDKTLYFFTSGRYEYRNKGFDITLAALHKLNERLIKEKSAVNVVMFLVTKRPTWSINPLVLQQRGVMEEFRKVCNNIKQQAGERLFVEGTSRVTDLRMPDLNDLVDDYWKLRFRRTLQSWKSENWPLVVTHNMKNDDDDEVIQFLRNAPLVNNPKDKVKIVYHPDFITSSSPLFGIEYNEFVRGCHLGVFPSFYEPWGYTPLECLAHGVPAITSDFAGFGEYMGAHFLGHELSGSYLLKRSKLKPDLVVKELSDMMYQFTQTSRRERIVLRNKAEDLAENYDWSSLSDFYNKAYAMAMN